MEVHYFIWALLPILLFLMGFWSLLKPIFGMKGRDHTALYFKQGAFCTLALLLSVWISKRSAFQNLLTDYSFWKIDLHLVQWLLYPAVLLLAAWVQQYLKHRKEKTTTRTTKRKR